MVLIRFYVPWLHNMERTTHVKKHGTACCIHAYHAAVSQLLACEKVPGTLYTVAVNMDDYQIRRKLSRVCHESSAIIELGGRLVQNN